jgi:Fe(3+) dicitrate transport protein
MKYIFPLITLIFSPSVIAQTTQQPEKKTIDTVQKLDQIILNANVMFGNKYVAKNRTGSSYYLSPEELKKFNYTDINRALRSVPGVNFYEEDGFGLRPNISLRGTSPERSAKITVMEDGVLIAPAPYSAPAAYYFPNVGRMQAVEILKGSSQIQYGPYTTGGAINMVSAQIPNNFQGQIRGSYGSFNTSQLHARVGDSKETVGYMVEFLNFNSDGFKNLPSGANTGFNRNDVVAKFRVNSKKEAKLQQSLEAKFQYADEDSDETYLGLTQQDFDRSPFDRYAGSQIDNITTENVHFMLMHTMDFSKDMRLTTQAYHNRFSRNWYKLNDVTANGQKVGIANILNNPQDFPTHMAIIRGEEDSENDAFFIRANNRVYYSQGVQTKFDWHFYGDETFHDIEIGVRYHYDQEDRFQWDDRYNMVNGVMNLTFDAIEGSGANRISSANALAAFAMYKFKYKNLTVTPGLRYENILLSRVDYGSNNPGRNPGTGSERDNRVDVWIPGIGFNYNIKDDLSIFGGVHKGFSPPGNEPGQQPEKSINYELGSRFTFGAFRGEVIGFYNDYSNLLGSDLAASGGVGTLDQFNAGAVRVNGLELLVNYDVLQKNSKLSIPISFGYTLTNTEFLSDFASNVGIWGDVSVGDEMPYIPKHQFNAMIGLEHQKFEMSLSGRYNGEFRTVAGTGSIPQNERVDANFIIDFAAKYHLAKQLSLTTTVINLLDEAYAVARVPAGLRPGHPFGIYGGLEFRF